MTTTQPPSSRRWHTSLLLLLATFTLSLIVHTRPVFAAGQPAALLNVPAAGFVGEVMRFAVSFDNTHPTDPGYGPYIDLALPAAGSDGAGAAIDDGITFTGATYLGTPIVPVVAPFICTGSFTHPLTQLVTLCTPGTQIVIIQPPYGSFTATQPPAEIVVSTAISNLADVNAALNIQATAGFFLGNDPLANPATDAPIIQSTPSSAAYTPLLWTLTKLYLGPEDETATGPNFPRQYRIDIDIADGQTITNLDIGDLLPPSMQFVRVDAVTTAVGTPTVTAVATPGTTTPGGTLARRLSSATGTTGAQDAALLFTFFVPRLDAASAVILPAASGDDRLAINDARASGSWAPLDARDSTSLVTNDVTASDHRLEEQSIAIQKGASNISDLVTTPADLIAYTLDLQVSDYFAFQDVFARDTLGDGLRFDDSFAPTLACSEHGVTTSGSFVATNYTLSDNWTDLNGAIAPNPGTPAPPHSLDPAANDGTTTITFRISDQLLGLGADAQLLGGSIPNGGTGAGPLANNPPLPFSGTSCQITYHAIIQDRFSDDYPSTDDSVDQGDILANTAIVDGAVLNVNNLSPSGQRENDDTGANVVIDRGDLSKTIYAINGDIACPPGNCSGATNTAIARGDTVTYRLRLTLPSSDVEDLRLIDYLPLPIFNINNASAPLISAITSFDPTVSSTPPPAGRAKFGPADDFTAESGIVPALNLDPVANSVGFSYGDYDDPNNTPNTIDILFTVTANYDPFADKLLLTNQLRELENSTNAGEQVLDRIVQLMVNEPKLVMRKGVVATNAANPSPASFALPAGVSINPAAACSARLSGAAPIVTSANLGSSFDSNVSGLDAGDQVTFAIVVQNIGSGPNGAYDVRVRDALPAGLSFVPGSLCVNKGANGAAIAFTSIGGGLFDPNGGIELSDPGDPSATQGVLGPGESRLTTAAINDGNNIAIVTFNATLDTSVGISQTLTNQGILFNYATANGGPDFTAIDLTDPATVTSSLPSQTKTLIDTSEAHTSAARVAVGELVRYRMASRLPEGTFNAVSFLDGLPTGLTFLDDGSARVAFVTNGSGITSSTLSGAGLTVTGNAASAAALPSASITFALPDAAVSRNATTDDDAYATGNDPYFKLGNIVNADNDADDEFIVVEFNALVDNTASGSNDAGDNRDNTFQFRLGTTQVGSTSNSVRVSVSEPVLSISKDVSPASGDAGDTVTYTLVLQNGSGVNTTSAFDLALSDLLPPSLINPALVSLTPSGAVSGATASFAGNSLSLSATSMGAGASITLVYSAELASSVTPGQSITNTAGLSATSLPGPSGTGANPTGSSTPGAPGTGTGERTGAGGLNDYSTSDPATVIVFVPNPLKTIVVTSEGHSAEMTPRPVAVGEIVRYRFEVRLAEGTSPAIQLRDSLPVGLRFLDDGTARAAFVANGGGIASSDGAIGTSPQINGSEASLASITPTFALPGTAIGGGPFASGSDVTMSLGDLINSDTDADQEFVVVEFNALVENLLGNQAGTLLDNTFEVIVDSTTRASSSANPSNRVVVVEPALSISKNVSPASGDAGDSVTYTLVLQNGSGVNTTSAFDLALSDLLPPSLINPALVSLTPSGAVSGATASFAGNSLSLSAASMGAGASITLVYSAELASSVTPGQSITNTAGLSATSLPGPSGTGANPTGSSTPGAPGTGTGERTGAGGLNDYSTSDPATITVGSPSFVKSLAATSAAHTGGSAVTIGEVVSYNLVVTLPEGTTPSLQIVDNLPGGMAYVAGSATVDSSGFSGSLPSPSITAAGGNGADVSLDFGPINVAGDNNAANNSFIVRIQARVLDVGSNVGLTPPGQTTLTNSATMQIGAATPLNGGSVDTPVVEPRMAISKTFTPASASANDTVLVSLVVQNTGSAEAFEVVIDDLLSDAELINPGAVTTPAGFTFSAAADTPAVGQTRVRYTGGSIPAGASRTFTFNVTLAPGVSIGQLIPNTATVSQATTLPGNDPNERDEPDVSGSDTLTVTAPDLTLSKDDGQTIAIPGQTLIYALLVRNVGSGEATGVVISETVPANSTFNAASSTAGWSCADASPAATSCTLALGTLAAGANRSAQFAVTLNSALPAGVTTLTNSASVADDGSNGADPTPTDNSASDIDTLSAAPDLTLTKDDGGLRTSPGGVLVYTLSYANVGDQGATGVVISETVPANSTFNAASSTAGWSCADASPAATSCTFNVGSLPAGASGSVAFALTVADPLPAGVTAITNSASVADDGSNGADPTPTDNSASDTTPTDATPDLTLTKDDGGLRTSPGGVLLYTLSYANVGDQDATGVVISETVPANSTFNAAGSTAGWSCADASPAATSCTLALGNLAAGASGSATFALTVDDPLPAGVTAIANSASVADDGNNGADPTPTDNSASDTTPTDATPDLTLSKDDGGLRTSPGALLVYTLSYANVGDQDATGVVISETVPANSTFNAASSTAGWSCADASPAATSCTLALGNLAAGASGSVAFALTVNDPLPAGVTAIANSASVADDGSNGADPTPTDNSASDSTPTDATPDLTLTKDDGGLRTSPGAVLVYTLSYANVGDQDASGVVISETVPANSTFNAAGSTAGWSCADASPAATSCTLALGNLAAGASGSATFALTVDDPLPAGVTTVANSASVADDGSNGADPTPTDNSASDTTPTDATPDLTLTKDDGQSYVVAGQVLTYTLTITNVGDQAATGVMIEDTLPANSSFVSASDSASVSSGVVAWPGFDLAAGASVTRSVTIQLDAPLPVGYVFVVNTASVTDDGSNGADPTPGNNSDDDTDQVPPDLALTKDDGGVSSSPGAVLTYTLAYTNVGTVDASGMVISETVPAHTRFDATGSTAGWSCADASPAATSCSFNVGSLPAGASGSVAFAVTVDDAVPAGVTTIANSASVADDGSNGADPTPPNNSDDELTPLNATPDLTLSKDDGGATALPGRTITYTLSYANVGDQGASGVVISETVPAHTRFAAAGSTAGWSCADASPAATSCSFNVGSLPAGASGSVAFAVTLVDPFPAGVVQITNSALIGDDGRNGSDPTPTNNTGEELSPISPTAISLVFFGAARSKNGVTVSWTTAAEQNTFGFELYRGTSPRRSAATRVSSALIPSTGRAQSGADYAWLDSAAPVGIPVYYWLVEVDLDGNRVEYGPVNTAPAMAATTILYLPLILR